MKKILFFSCLAVSFSAIGQQNQFFDINKYILKKQAENKKTFEKKKFEIPFRNKFNLNLPFSSNKSEYTYTLPNGDRVVILSTYNMPCIVPDMKMFQSMPNAGINTLINDFNLKKKKPGNIPNGSKSFKMLAYTPIANKH